MVARKESSSLLHTVRALYVGMASVFREKNVPPADRSDPPAISSGGSELTAGGTFFSRNTEALPTYSARTVRYKEELSLRATVDRAVSLSTYIPLPMDVVH